MIAPNPTIEAWRDELAALQERVAELERERDQAKQFAELYQAIFDVIPMSVQVCHLEQPGDPRSMHLVAANAAMKRTSKVDVGAKIGMRLLEIYPNMPDNMLQIQGDVIQTGQPRNLGELTYHVDDEN